MTIQDGFYECKATGAAEYGVTDTGTDQIAVELEVYGPDQTVIETRNTYLSFTEKAAPYAIDKLRALGFTGDNLAKLDGLGSKVARCSVKTEEYNGKVSQKIDVFGERGPAFKQPMSPDGARKFAARFNHLLSAPKGARPASNGGAQKSGPGGAPFMPGDDADIPFLSTSFTTRREEPSRSETGSRGQPKRRRPWQPKTRSKIASSLTESKGCGM